MNLYTIGFTQRSAREFFEILAQNGVQRVVDIRIHPEGQLAGFTKKGDLQYFLQALNGCDYIHLKELAPSEEIFKAYRADQDWTKFERDYKALLVKRGIPQSLDRHIFEEKACCLLCSENSAQHCHRRFAAEVLASGWGNILVVDL